MYKEYEILKKAFYKNDWKWDYSKGLTKNIKIKNKGNMYLYNYSDKWSVDRNHPVLMKCRGLVLRCDGKVLNFPFDRFFNEFEKEHSKINWDTALIQEKLDGSLICVFWNGNDWEVTTRGSFYPNEKTHEDYVDYEKLFKKHFNNFNMLGTDYCYMFELITKKNRIVTWYDDEMVYLIGARQLEHFRELDNDTLNLLASSLNVKRPKMFKATNFDECRKLFEKFKDDEEGLVVVDNMYNRVKLKQESYIRLSKIKMLKEQDIFDYILGKTGIDTEYLVKCPDVLEKIDFMANQWTELKLIVMSVFNRIKNKKTRKEFAIEAVKYPFKSLLFTKLDGGNIEDMSLKWERIKEWILFNDCWDIEADKNGRK